MNDPPRWRDSEPELRDALFAMSRPHAEDAESLARIAASLPIGPPPVPANAMAVKIAVAAMVAGAAIAGSKIAVQEPAPKPPIVHRVAKQEAPPIAAPPPPPKPKAPKPKKKVEQAPIVIAQPVPAIVETDEPSMLAEEARLLLAAKRRMRADPEEALALLELHQRRYPQGKLQEERELLGLEIGCALGHDVSSEASEFLTRFPSSAHTARAHELKTSPCKRAP